MSEISLCTEGKGFDIPKLCAQPCLQSGYAEVLRLRVAIGSKRFHLLLTYCMQYFDHLLVVFCAIPK